MPLIRYDTKTNMKKILLFLGAFLLGFFSLFAQQFDGTYKSSSDSIVFSNEKVTFRISGFGGLSAAHVGNGTYEQVGDYLLIHTSDYPGTKTTYETLEGSKEDTCVVHVVSQQGYAIQGILVEARNKSGKLIKGKVTGNDGRVFFTPCDKIGSLSVTSLGYHSITFDNTPGKDYRVKLAENEIIEHKTVVFKIDLIDEDTLSILMLEDDYRSGKDRDKELQKLEKKARKTNKLEKRLKKVYIPYHMRP